MNKVLVSTKIPYEVLIGSGLLSGIGNEFLKIKTRAKVLVVTDDNVEKLYLEKVLSALDSAGFDARSTVIKSGEKSKTPETYLNIIKQAASMNFTREDLFAALGGGVVGDITGFAAATYMRGADFVQIPTTLLAATDASVGGKTGVDLPNGKNLLGAFHQPMLVLFDTDTLITLPKSEMTNGIGEGIKYAVLCGGRILEILECGLCEKNMAEYVSLAVGYKRDVVEEDERESGRRKLLNLGHTFGHAIEKLSYYEIPHGIAVAKGLKITTQISLHERRLSCVEYEKILGLFEKYDIDASCPYGADELLEAVKSDKKIGADGTLSFVNINSIGDCFIDRMSVEKLKDCFNEREN